MDHPHHVHLISHSILRVQVSPNHPQVIAVKRMTSALLQVKFLRWKSATKFANFAHDLNCFCDNLTHSRCFTHMTVKKIISLMLNPHLNLSPPPQNSLFCVLCVKMKYGKKNYCCVNKKKIIQKGHVKGIINLIHLVCDPWSNTNFYNICCTRVWACLVWI